LDEKVDEKVDEKAHKLLEDDLGERPFASLQDRCGYMETVRDGTLCESLYHVPRHSPDRLYKEKGGRSATERELEFKRAAWRVMVAWAVEPERLLFVDECGLHTSLAPIYGYAPKGERLRRLSVPPSRAKNTTLLFSSMTIEGMGPSLAVEGATTRGDHRPGLRDLCREGARAKPTCRADRGDGQAGSA
jgi:hypothetical protein